MAQKKQILYKYGLCTLICIFFFVLYILLGYVRYSTNDDTGFNTIAAGFMGGESEKLYFINIIYGYVLKFLYSITPSVNWYLWLMLMLNLSAVCMLAFSVANRTNNLLTSAFFTTVINVCLGEQLYNNLQFTKNASFLMIVGLFVIVEVSNISNKLHKRVFCFIGIVQFLFGFMIRRESFFLIIPFFVLTVSLYIYMNKLNIKELCIPLLCMIIGVAVVSLVDYSIMKHPSEWNEYWEYQSVRADLMDKGLPEYYSNEEMYNSIGWNENEYNLFASWISIDEAYSYDNLKVIYDSKKNNRNSIVINKELLKSLFTHIYQKGIKVFIFPHVYLFILILLIIRHKKKGIIYLITSLCVFIFYYGYFVYIGRPAWRVTCSIWMAYIIFSVLILMSDSEDDEKLIRTIQEYLKEKNIDFKRYYIVAVLLVLSLLFIERIIPLLNDYNEIKGGQIFFRAESVCNQFIDYTIDDNNTYYVDTLKFGDKFKSVWDIKCNDINANLNKKYVTMGGWIVPSPTWEKYYKDNKPELKKLYLDDSTFFVTSSDDIAFYLLGFLCDNYDSNIVVELVGEHSELKVWKYYIGN